MSDADIKLGPQPDPEFVRIGRVMAILDPLSQRDINRILAYLVSRYEAKPEAK
jgi:hypothetical protein